MDSVHTALSQWKGVGNSELVDGRFMTASLVYDLGVEWLWNTLLVGTATTGSGSGEVELLVPECLRATSTQSTMSKISTLYMKACTDATAAPSPSSNITATWTTALTSHIQTHYLSNSVSPSLPSEVAPLVARLATIVGNMYEGILSEMYSNNNNEGTCNNNKMMMAV